MEQLNSINELAWVAGIMEGEGNCSMVTCTDRRHNKTYVYRKLRVQLGMSDVDVIEKVHEIVRAGHVYNYAGKQETYKRIYRWQITDEAAAAEFLENIKGYMGARRKAQIQSCLDEYYSIQEEKTKRALEKTFCEKCSGPAFRRKLCREHYNEVRREKYAIRQNVG